MSVESTSVLSSSSMQSALRKFGSYSPASTTASTPNNNKENYYHHNENTQLQPVGVPEGCIVRNTFIEWDEPESCANGIYDLTPKRRSKSCPKAAIRSPEECQTPSIIGSGSPCTSDSGSANGEDAPCRPNAFSLESNGGSWRSQEPEQRRSVSTANTWQMGQSPHSGSYNGSDNGYGNQSWKSPKNNAAGRSSADVVVLRGLPFNVTEADMAAFLEQAGVSSALASCKPVNLLTNASGKPSGYAEIQLKSEVHYWEVHEKLHMQRLGSRYIEVFPQRANRRQQQQQQHWKSDRQYR